MDGGSSDGTRGILEKYRPWLSAVNSAPDCGQGHALNLGFSLGSGSVVGWLNSDDFYLPRALGTVATAFSDPTLEFFHADGLYLLQETGEYRYSSGQLALDRYLHFGGLIMSHTAFWRNEIHQPIWEAMQCNVDGELWFSCPSRTPSKSTFQGQLRSTATSPRSQDCESPNGGRHGTTTS